MKHLSLQQWMNYRKNFNSSIGFVPTMGALHEGHLSLIKNSLLENQLTLVSIYLNPTQFNNSEDLEKYPCCLEEDKNLLEELKYENKELVLITPNYSELYPDDFNYKVTEEKLSSLLCGQHRPGHFTGVLTVVLKLLNLARANKAYFGEKDYQQYYLIKQMAQAFFIPTEIIPCPIVREPDGLAMSSRNKRLDGDQRQLAPQLYEVLKKRMSADETKEALKKYNIELEYLEDLWGRRFAAAQLGSVRLIDNLSLIQEAP